MSFAYRPKISEEGIQLLWPHRVAWDNINSASFQRIRGYSYIVIEKKNYLKIFGYKRIYVPLSMKDSAKLIKDIENFAPAGNAILPELGKFDPSTPVNLKWKIYRWAPTTILLTIFIATSVFKAFLFFNVSKLSEDAARGVFTYNASIEACEYKQDTSRPSIYKVGCCKLNQGEKARKDSLPENVVSLSPEDKGVLILSRASLVLIPHSMEGGKYPEKFFYRTADPTFCQKLKTNADGEIKAKFHNCKTEGFLSPPCVFAASYEIEPGTFPPEIMK